MKQFKSTAYLIAALIGTSIAATGCGGSGSDSTAGAPGSVIGAPITTLGVVTPGVGGSVSFGDVNARDTGAAIIDYTPSFSAQGFVPIQGYAGALSLGGVGLPGGQTSTLTGVTTGGSTITVTTGPGTQACPFGLDLCSGISGSISISAADSAGLAMGSIQGLAIGLTRSGSVISMGQAWICTTRDQYGQCHGIVLQFVPH